jgi:hypothetical protein
MAGLAFAALVELERPYPFATTDDNWMYFLPLIKAHTDSLLSGHFLQALWSLGAGWSPWENAQTGPFYLPYHLSNLLARILGEPLALLDVSSILHILAAGMVTYALLPRERDPWERAGWACLAMVQPGPFILGLNWHIYLSSYPWFIALALLGLRREEGGLPGRGTRLALLGCNVGFFLASHAQMFVLGWMLLLPWWYAVAGREGWKGRLGLAVALQLPMAAPLAFMKAASLSSHPGWMIGRDDPYYLLAGAQKATTVLGAMVAGNLGPALDFRLWGTSWTGAGMLFNPLFLVLGALALVRKRFGLLALLAGMFLFLAAGSFPFLRFLAAGPLAGFRWTWKLCIATGPLVLLGMAWLVHEFRVPPRLLRVGIPVLAFLSAAVCIQGMGFEFWPSFNAAHPFGAVDLVRQTRTFAREAGLPPGARIALVGEVDMVQPLPLPYLALVGNAPILSGLETAHLYEPLESAKAAGAHYGLSLPWRQPVSAESYAAEAARVELGLRHVGVDAVICPFPGILPGAQEVRDVLGRRLWVKRLEPGPPRYPWGRLGDRDIAMQRLPGGGLRTAVPVPDLPRLLSPRAMAWERGPDGHWTGRPLGPGWAWLALTFLGAIAALSLCLRSWPSRSASLPAS